MFVERSTQYTSFSPRKQPANAGTECKQFTENASVALQQPILTHAYTKCPPVACGADGRSLARTLARSVYGHVITKFSGMGRLPHFLSYGAPPTRALRARVELRYNCLEYKEA